MWRTASLALLGLAFGIVSANASVTVTVDKSTQRLTVSVDGVPRYNWPVSTARWGYNTPNGVYSPQRLEKQWYSRKYDMSPMPHSIFFDGGYAIHGSYEVSHLGRPASHGCIRLSPAHAATLFALVQSQRHETRIVVKGDRPASYEAIARNRSQRQQTAQERYPYRYRYSNDFQNAFEWGGPRRNTWVGNNGYWYRN